MRGTWWRRLPRIRLWAKLAIFGAVGVVLTHAIHLSMSNRVASYALARSQESLGRNIARLVANEAADAVLLDDLISLKALMRSAVAGHGVGYCFIVRDGQVLASSLADAVSTSLVGARAPSDTEPFVAISGTTRFLDIAEPILGGSAGMVRVGVDLEVVRETRRQVARVLGLLAVAVILAGIIAAAIVGRSVTRPIARLVSATKEFDPSGKAPVLKASSRDEIGGLTERFNQMMVRLKAAHEEQLHAREKQAETERMAALGTLVAGVAHEVNNPLAGMKNCLRRLQREDLMPPGKRQEYLELMEEGLERIEEVMHHLLDFARPRTLRLSVIAVREVVREGAGLLRPILARRNIELREELEDLAIVADRKQAGQALLNLLLNASHVTAEGGQIRICTRTRGSLCGISVEDDGPGVPPDLRDRILAPFFTTKPEGEGTGLGLSVTRSIVEAHGGELTLDFPERGTVATIWLRLTPAAAAASPADSPG